MDQLTSQLANQFDPIAGQAVSSSVVQAAGGFPFFTALIIAVALAAVAVFIARQTKTNAEDFN